MPIDINNILNRLNHESYGSGDYALSGNGFKIYFKDGTAYISAVDKNLNPIYPSNVGGDEGVVVRMMQQVSDDIFFSNNINYDSLSCKISDIAYAMYALVRCKNLYGPDGQRLKVTQSSGQLCVEISEPADDDLSAKLVLRDESGNTHPATLLTDAFVLSGDEIVQIPSIGENFNSLAIFADKFKKNMLPTYLSALLSAFDNIDIIYPGYKLVESGAESECVPTVVFEKIESDRTLLLSVTDSLPGDEFVSAGSNILTKSVTVADNGHIIVKRIKHIDLPKFVGEITDEIRQYASGRNAKKDVFADGTYIYVPEETASAFLLRGLPSLLEKYRLVGIDRLKEYKIRPVVPKLSLKFSSGIDYLDASAEVDLGTEKITLAELLKQVSKHDFITLSDGSRGVLDEAFIKRVTRIFKPDKKDPDKYKVTIFDLPEIEQLTGSDDNQPALKKPRQFYKGFAKLPKEKLDLPEVHAKLRKYQAEGVKWLKYLYDNNIGGCLADDMGLGKTLQAIGLLSLVKDQSDKPMLLVMPRSLLFNWQAELEKFSPSLDFHVYYGQNRDLDEALKHKIIITTYALVRNDIEQLSKIEFDTILLDESQNIKNVSAQMTRSVYILKADHRFALSGTPVENNLSELYSLFHFLNPSMFGSLDDFNERYGKPIQRDNDRDAAEMLRRKIYPFVLLRLKRDVLKDLPDRVDQTIFVDMDPEMSSFYDRRRRSYLERIQASLATEGINKARFAMLQAMSELRRIASVPESLSDGQIKSPKIEYLAENVQSAVENGHKVVVFFNFIAGIELLGDKLDEMGIDFASMTGSTSDRKSIVERFQNDVDCKVLLMTLKTGGVGLNLTAADIVFIAEPWWNKAAEEQAINRLHRIGQKSSVFTFSVITHGTIEEKIMQLQQQKAELFNNIISGDEASSKNLTEDDIKFILGK